MHLPLKCSSMCGARRVVAPALLPAPTCNNSACTTACCHRPRHVRGARAARAATVNESDFYSQFLPLGEGDFIAKPIKRSAVAPNFDYSRDEAIAVQLAALAQNDKPAYDHGIEVLYRFANFDPFSRSKYFGKSFDLGQFERFRRIMHIPAYKVLLNHDNWTQLSTLKVSEHMWKTRIHVVGEYGHEQGVYEITMVQRLGGRYDGFWFTESLVADGNDWHGAAITY